MSKFTLVNRYTKESYHRFCEIGLHTSEGTSSHKYSSFTFPIINQLSIPVLGPASGSIWRIVSLTGPLGAVALGSIAGGMVES